MQALKSCKIILAIHPEFEGAYEVLYKSSRDEKERNSILNSYPSFRENHLKVLKLHGPIG
jgi:hypothetical protein